MEFGVAKAWADIAVNRDRAALVAEEVAKGTDFGFALTK